MDGKRVKREWAEKILTAAAKYRYALLVLLLGAVLMLLPGGKREASAPDPETETAFDRAAVQREMEQILSRIDGVGRLHLMLTVVSGGEQELAQNESVSRSASPEGTQEYTQKTETVLLGRGSEQQAVVKRTLYPRYVGALVVCEGAENAAVRLQVVQAVSALTALPADRISVVKGSP